MVAEARVEHIIPPKFKKSAQFTDLYYVYAGYFRISENPNVGES